MPRSSCPMCRKPSADRTAARTPWPFCSDRCRLIDLGKWLDEDYRIPDGPPGSAPPEPTTDD